MRCLTTFILAMLLVSPVQFVGVEVDGKTVAFVCDGSRWMKKKIDDLTDQLKKSVDAMKADQQFAVIFFADDKASGFADGKPVSATEDKRKLGEWLDQLSLGENSTPAVGLTRAFEGKPDAVVFVSDGEFKDYDGVWADVARLNADQAVRVHAIGFFENTDDDDSRAFVTFMKKLAEQNGGRFKAVYADELKRAR